MNSAELKKLGTFVGQSSIYLKITLAKIIQLVIPNNFLCFHYYKLFTCK